MPDIQLPVPLPPPIFPFITDKKRPVQRPIIKLPPQPPKN